MKWLKDAKVHVAVLGTVLLLAACQEAGPAAPNTPVAVEDSKTVTVYVDSARNVVCYYVKAGLAEGGVSIDCLELTQP